MGSRLRTGLLHCWRIGSAADLHQFTGHVAETFQDLRFRQEPIDIRLSDGLARRLIAVKAREHDQRPREGLLDQAGRVEPRLPEKGVFVSQGVPDICWKST